MGHWSDGWPLGPSGGRRYGLVRRSEAFVISKERAVIIPKKRVLVGIRRERAMILATTTKQALVDIPRGVVLTIPGQRVCGTLRERFRDIPREYPTKLITAGQQLELVLKTTVERVHVAGDEDVRRKREREAVVLAGGKNDGKYGRRRRCEEGSWREDEEGARRVRGRCEGHWKRMGINTLVPTQAGNSGRCSEDVCIGACRQRYPKAAGIFKLQGHREPAAAAVWALGK